MTEDREKELRFKVWSLAQSVLRDAFNSPTAGAGLTDEEYAYAREFMHTIITLIFKRGHEWEYVPHED